MDLNQIIDSAPEKFRPEFRQWLAANFHVWQEFRSHCDELRVRGRKHYSARTIIEVLRHESGLREAGGDYKISNDAVPDLARLYLLTHPDADGFFSVKVRA